MGTDAWRNWEAFINANPESENADDELFSDRHFVGGPTTFGPYTLATIIRHDTLSAVPRVGLAVRLHVGVHADLIPEVLVDGQLVKPNSEAYHGGTASDEIAALVALTLGVRLRFAGTAQLSGRHEYRHDQHPIHLSVPALAHPGQVGREHIPATLTRPADLGQLDRLNSFPGLNVRAQVELVRAARSYASAIWWANEDPNLSWLRLVSSVEIAASYRQELKAEPVELVTNLWPELSNVLHGADASVREEVAKLVAPQMRATRKFVSLLTECAPQPPTTRHEFARLDWDKINHFAKLIYKYRSDALHAGKPFPLPMLELPMLDEGGAVQEVPLGLNAGGLGGVWDAEQTPMLLSTFEYIARGCLLNWWDEVASQ